jgi:hypothetical protein
MHEPSVTISTSLRSRAGTLDTQRLLSRYMSTSRSADGNAAVVHARVSCSGTRHGWRTSVGAASAICAITLATLRGSYRDVCPPGTTGAARLPPLHGLRYRMQALSTQLSGTFESVSLTGPTFTHAFASRRGSGSCIYSSAPPEFFEWTHFYSCPRGTFEN